MPISKSTGSQEVSLFAIDVAINTAKTGDSANISSQISIDGGASAASSGTITEEDATNAPGMYELPLSIPETNGDLLVITPVSSTADIKLDPLVIYTEGAPLKNTANYIAVLAVDKSTNTKKTGDAGNITAQIAIDGGAFTASNQTNPTELDSTNHPGVYIYTMLAAELNGDRINFTPVSSTSNIVLDPLVIYTRVAASATSSGGGYVPTIRDIN